MPAKYLNILALSAIIFLACSFSPNHVAALDSPGLQARHAQIGQALAKRAPKRCKVRPHSSHDGHTTPSPPAATPKIKNQPPPPTPRKGKAGLALAIGDDQAKEVFTNFKTSKVSFYHNWRLDEVQGKLAKDLGYEFIPSISRRDTVGQIKAKLVRKYATRVLGFNEPDIGGQADMTPQEAASLWKEHVLQLRQLGYELISPATTSSPNGITWMKDFLKACGHNCVDKIAVHWYGTKADDLIKYLENWHNTFQKNIWVTEFACMDFSTNTRCTKKSTMQFATTITNFLDKTSWIEGYTPFAIVNDLSINPVNILLDGTNHPTELAEIYFGKK